MAGSEPRAALGSRLRVRLLTAEGPEEMDLTLVPDAAADFARGRVGETAPLAQALLGRRAGEKAPYRAGDVYAVEILAVEPGDAEWDDQAAARRADAARRAAEEVGRTNMINFASSFSGKWGDYDPDGLTDVDADTEKPGA